MLTFIIGMRDKVGMIGINIQNNVLPKTNPTFWNVYREMCCPCLRRSTIHRTAPVHITIALHWIMFGMHIPLDNKGRVKTLHMQFASNYPSKLSKCTHRNFVSRRHFYYGACHNVGHFYTTLCLRTVSAIAFDDKWKQPHLLCLAMWARAVAGAAVEWGSVSRAAELRIDLNIFICINVCGNIFRVKWGNKRRHICASSNSRHGILHANDVDINNEIFFVLVCNRKMFVLSLILLLLIRRAQLRTKTCCWRATKTCTHDTQSYMFACRYIYAYIDANIRANGARNL